MYINNNPVGMEGFYKHRRFNYELEGRKVLGTREQEEDHRTRRFLPFRFLER